MSNARWGDGMSAENTLSVIANATRIIWVNGDLDPFSWGSVTANTTTALRRDVVALLVRAGPRRSPHLGSSTHDAPARLSADLACLDSALARCQNPAPAAGQR